MLRRALAIGVLLGATFPLSAQEQTQQTQQPQLPGYTQMLIGVGHTFDEAAWSLGVEHKPAGSRVAWRALLEQWDHHTVLPSADQPDLQARRFLGAQLLGLRVFRQPRRLQPYVLGGLAMYRERYVYSFSPHILNPDGSTSRGPAEAGHGERVHGSLFWGTGLNLRVSGVTVFGEVKLPVPRTGRGTFSAAPLLLGIRF